jgi:phosphatidylglycerol---prolipoprotein diacylglyceryl transferase
MPAALQYPSWLKPEIIPGLPLRWYGVMYVIAFAVSWLVFRYESKRRGASWSDEDAELWFFWAIIGLLVGARLFGTLVYDPTDYYRQRPWLIFWPFDESIHFTGFQGMSYHGGFFGLIVATLIYCAARKQSWLAYADVIAVSAPLGYTFGRLGNFINGELWGKVTSAPIGMIFPTVPDSGRFPASEAWVQAAATKAGIRLSSLNELVNLPRHPSQLYEAFFEGFVLWLLLWLFVRKRRAFTGFATGVYAMGYGTIRFVIEYFREPDQGMGFIVGDKSAPTYVVTSVFNLSMGQLLSSLMILGGALLIYFCSKAAPAESVSRNAADGAARGQPDEGRTARPRSASREARKLRKRIK